MEEDDGESKRMKIEKGRKLWNDVRCWGLAKKKRGEFTVLDRGRCVSAEGSRCRDLISWSARVTNPEFYSGGGAVKETSRG